MTLEVLIKCVESYPTMSVEELIMKYDKYFENPICKNCTSFKDGECRIYKGAKSQCTMYELDDTFGCNKFTFELNK